MASRVRKTIFWTHLTLALGAGLVIALMAFTGAMLSFEPQLREWAERSTRAVIVSDPATRRPLAVDEILARVRESRPEQPLAAVVLHAGPSAVLVSSGREGGVHVDPYTGQVRALAGQGWRDFFGTVIDLHRALGAAGERRAVGRAFTGVANAVFLVLALSGLYLWWPARWTRRALRLSLWFRYGLRSKTRDWNWHNVIGFWSVPVLLVVTTSGMTLSYRWAGNLVFRIVGETPPEGPAGPPVEVPAPPPGTRRLPLQALVDATKQIAPDWRTITLRLRDPARGGGSRPSRPERGRGPTAIVISVKEVGAWPPFASTQLSFDPFTGRVLRQEAFASYSAGRRLRFWLRFLHTGEALGWPGQLAVGLVSLTAPLLVWTGFALAYRRLFRRRSVTTPTVPASDTATG
jgi:uncharacterized iron-regulated membrane protein